MNPKYGLLFLLVVVGLAVVVIVALGGDKEGLSFPGGEADLSASGVKVQTRSD